MNRYSFRAVERVIVSVFISCRRWCAAAVSWRGRLCRPRRYILRSPSSNSISSSRRECCHNLVVLSLRPLKKETQPEAMESRVSMLLQLSSAPKCGASLDWPVLLDYAGPGLSYEILMQHTKFGSYGYCSYCKREQIHAEFDHARCRSAPCFLINVEIS